MEGPDAPRPFCTPGAQNACECPGGGQGVQTCSPSGAEVSACICPDAAAPTDAEPPGDAPSDVMWVEGPDAPDVATVADAPSGDVAPDAGDPLARQVEAVAVTVRASGTEWTMPRSQMCALMGATASVGAEYERPERAAFTVSGPVAGPVVLTMVGAGGTGTSDIRATIQRGADYFTAGGTVRRANVVVRGTIPGGLMLEVTALGCLVR